MYRPIHSGTRIQYFRRYALKIASSRSDLSSTQSACPSKAGPPFLPTVTRTRPPFLMRLALRLARWVVKYSAPSWSQHQVGTVPGLPAWL
jgi:hypothetical protein